MTSEAPKTSGKPPGGVTRFFASNPGYGVVMAAPVAALALVSAHAFAGVALKLAWFSGYVAVGMALIAVSQTIRLAGTFRIGSLKVSGVVVRRADDPKKFKRWTTIVVFQTGVEIAVALALIWVTITDVAA